MDNPNSNNSEDRWVDDRLRGLAPPPNWQPNTDRAFERILKRQDYGSKSRWLRLSMAGAIVVASCAVLALLPWSSLVMTKSGQPGVVEPAVQTRQDSIPAVPATLPETKSTPAAETSSVPRTEKAVATTPASEKTALPDLPGIAAESAVTATEAAQDQRPPKKLWMTGGGIAAPSTAGAAQDNPPQARVTEPVIISRVQPVYTQEAKEARVTGTVELLCTVHKDGSVTVESVRRGLGYGLDESATEAVTQWRFTPGMRDGTPVDTTVSILVNFGLK